MIEDREAALDALADAEQVNMFGSDEDFHRAWQEWKGMPEFVQEDLEPWMTCLVHFGSQRPTFGSPVQPDDTILVHFAGPADRRAFEALVGQPVRRVGAERPAIWFADGLAAFERLVEQKVRHTTRKSAFIWYPKAAVGKFADKRYRDASGDPK